MTNTDCLKMNINKYCEHLFQVEFIYLLAHPSPLAPTMTVTIPYTVSHEQLPASLSEHSKHFLQHSIIPDCTH